MTEENYNYRTNPLFLRNQFAETDDFGIPEIPKCDFSEDELKGLLLIGFDKARTDKLNFDRVVHFFLYDYNFESIWKKPDDYVDKLKEYKAVLSPDFSMYIEMNRALQIYNTFRNRWCGAYLASKGIKVIPTVNWGNEDTFDFCFDGIPEGSIVAVSTYMVHEHNNHSDQKEFFMKGYNEMFKRIKPEKIICYSEPFEEMEGDIIYVDYELSGWKYLNREAKSLREKKGGGIIVYKTMIQPEGFISFKGTGSAYGGPWKPKKPEDEILLGEPGEIKVYYTKKGAKYESLIGSNSKACVVRHNTDHSHPKYHSDPHDHFVKWDSPDGHPEFEQVNYNGVDVPELTSLRKGYNNMEAKNIFYQTEDYENFESQSEFKICLIRGGEVQFIWKGKQYTTSKIIGGKFFIAEAYNEETEVVYDTAEELLDYVVGEDKLRDIITKVEIVERTL